MPKAQVEALADHIAAEGPIEENQSPLEIGFMELLSVDPELSSYLSNVVLLRDDQSPDVTVDTPGVATELPDDGSWTNKVLVEGQEVWRRRGFLPNDEQIGS